MKKRDSGFEHMPYLQVVSMTPESARQFFGMPNAYVVDAGPPPAERAGRYAPEARVFHVYPNGKPRGGHLRIATRDGEKV